MAHHQPAPGPLIAGGGVALVVVGGLLWFASRPALPPPTRPEELAKDPAAVAPAAVRAPAPVGVTPDEEARSEAMLDELGRLEDEEVRRRLGVRAEELRTAGAVITEERLLHAAEEIRKHVRVELNCGLQLKLFAKRLAEEDGRPGAEEAFAAAADDLWAEKGKIFGETVTLEEVPEAVAAQRYALVKRAAAVLRKSPARAAVDPQGSPLQRALAAARADAEDGELQEQLAKERLRQQHAAGSQQELASRLEIETGHVRRELETIAQLLEVASEFATSDPGHDDLYLKASERAVEWGRSVSTNGGVGRLSALARRLDLEANALKRSR